MSGNPKKLSKGASLDPDHHIIKYVRPTQIEEGVINGEAFLARSSDGGAVSYNWIEYYTGTIEEQINCIKKCARLEYAATGKLAKLNIKKSLAAIKDMISDCDVNYDPLDPLGDHPEDPSHALMTNIPKNDSPWAETLGDKIRDTMIETYAARG